MSAAKMSGRGGAASTHKRDRARVKSRGVFAALGSSLVSHLPQFVVIVVGGAIVSAIFQYAATLREQSIERQKFEREQFLQLRREVDQLITQRIVVMDRMASRLEGSDYYGAMELRWAGYEQAVSDWNKSLNRILRPLRRLEPCARPQANAEEASDTHVCPYIALYNNAEEGRIVDGHVPGPRSVHFAFFNASDTLIDLLSSDWTYCVELLQQALAKSKKECIAQVTSYENESISAAAAECVSRLRRLRDKEIRRCEQHEGFALQDKLKRELTQVRTRWSVLDRAFSRLEEKYH